MSNRVNKQVRLAARPEGLPKPENWEFTSEPVPEPGPGQIVVAISHLSVDPAMRGWMNAGASYIPPVEIGAVMRAAAVGEVIASQHPGFDAAINYRTANLRRALREHAPDGVDVYFDNVGGEILDAVLTRLARGARVVICGAVSQYNQTQVRGPANYLMLLVARASMTGMVVFDYEDRYPQAMAELAGWLTAGKLVTREHVVSAGLDAFPDVLLMLFEGANTGKLVLALEPS